MQNTKSRRERRARQTRVRIAKQNAVRLSVFRSNTHIYASLISPCGTKVLTSASTLEKDLRAELGDASSSSVAAAALVGKHIAAKGLAAGVKEVAFDRSGFAYHGRVKALADAAREAGLQF